MVQIKRLGKVICYIAVLVFLMILTFSAIVTFPVVVIINYIMFGDTGPEKPWFMSVTDKICKKMDSWMKEN